MKGTNVFFKALLDIANLEVGLWKTAQDIAREAIRTRERHYYKVRYFCQFTGKEKTTWLPKD